MTFIRQFADIQKLKSETLFKDYLWNDIRENFKGIGKVDSDVFPAIRDRRIDLYHKGGKLFSYDKNNGFTTHHKYASVIKYDPSKPYVSDTELHAINSFEEGYSRIKENCALYSGVESIGVSKIYGKYSCAKYNRHHRVVVLDIEISFRRDEVMEEPEAGENKRAHSDRIDLLLLDTMTGKLRFFEAKDFSNNELRANSGNNPSIVKQMERYSKQLRSTSKQKHILENFERHVDVINELFQPEVPLPKPIEVDEVPHLFIFGFDASQRSQKLINETNRLKSDFGLSVYSCGNPSQVKPDTLFKLGKRNW